MNGYSRLDNAKELLVSYLEQVKGYIDEKLVSDVRLNLAVQLLHTATQLCEIAKRHLEDYKSVGTKR